MSRLGSLGNLFDGGLFVDIDLLVRLFLISVLLFFGPYRGSLYGHPNSGNQRACFLI